MPGGHNAARQTRVAAALVLTVASGVGVGATAQARPRDTARDSASTSADSAAPSAPAASDERRSLTGPQVKAQLAQAAALQKQLSSTNSEVAAASRRLAQLSATSSAAMSAVAAAKSDEAKAEAVEKKQVALLRRLSVQAARAKRDVNGMAYDAYVNGSGELRDVAALVQASGGGGQDAALVRYLADARSADGRRYSSLAKIQQVTAKAAVSARLQREAATRRAVAAQRKATTSLAAQQRALLDLQKVATSKTAALTQLGVSTSSTAGVNLQTLAAATTKPLCTQDTGTYANGQIPATALCPITGAPGHMMRPTAARALNALKAAYKADLGTDLCITDTYRSLAAQVDVRARKPTLAAVPGTSNHGLGLATDLCGGIENFGTPQHLWMQQHAPLFGFFHPQWAEPTGSKPEPWHWEFAV